MWAERRRVGTRVPLYQIQSSYKAELTAWQAEILVKKEETYTDDENFKIVKHFFLINSLKVQGVYKSPSPVCNQHQPSHVAASNNVANVFWSNTVQYNQTAYIIVTRFWTKICVMYGVMACQECPDITIGYTHTRNILKINTTTPNFD